MKIICIHQSAELYGSDRSFLQVVEFLNRNDLVEELLVLLPTDGPLVDELIKRNISFRIEELFILRKIYLRKMQLWKLFSPLLSLFRRYQIYRSYDVIYCNTTVIMEYYLVAPFLRKKEKIIHVREIPDRILSRFFTRMINFGNIRAVFNSLNTEMGFKDVLQSSVIYNSFEGFGETDSYENQTSVKENTLNLLVIGRINDWKGQDLAIDALAILDSHFDFKLRIVGSPYEGNEWILDSLKQRVKLHNMGDKVEFIPFTINPKEHYEWCDVLIVPSKKPEPFGRIAIEAMSIAKPVIAAFHGGLSEIIKDDQNGFLFIPNSKESLNSCIAKYFGDAGVQLRKEHGRNGKQIFDSKFSSKIFESKLSSLFRLDN